MQLGRLRPKKARMKLASLISRQLDFNQHTRRNRWKIRRHGKIHRWPRAEASSAKQTKTHPMARHGQESWPFRRAFPPGRHRGWCCHCQVPTRQPPHYLCPPRPRPRAPGRIDGAGGAPIGRPRARAPRPRVRCARLPLGTSEFCFAVASCRRVDRAIHSLGLFRCGALVELGNILASDFCVVCGLIERSFVRVMQWLCFHLSLPTMGTNTARVSSGAGRIPPLGARRTGTN